MRKKIASLRAGDFDLLLSGAGDGPLVDGFVARIKKTARGVRSLDFDSLADWMHSELSAYLKQQGIRPSRASHKIRFVIAAQSKTLNRCEMWSTCGASVTEVAEYSIIGFEDYRYEYAVQNLYQPQGITIAQGIFLGLFVMSLAEQTSNYVRRPISVVVVKDNGIYTQPKELITELHNRVQLFASHFDKLFLACPDTGLQYGEFAEKVNEFVRSIGHIRREYVEEMLGKKIEEGLDKVNDPYSLIPAGTTFVINPTPQQAEEYRKMREDMAKGLRENFGYVQEPERVISNLESLKRYYKKLLSLTLSGEAVTQEEQKIAVDAQGEIMQAALMGPNKVSQDVCNLLQRLCNVIPLDINLGEHADPRMHLATNLLRVAVVEQTLAYMQRDTTPPLTSQMSEGQP
jgi:hypothetical protein